MAAGLGFKDFVTGEVLTAADVDGYLMQGVWVFANATARDAAVTSPQEGNFAYLKDTNVTTYYTGSAWANLDTTGMTNPMTTTGDMIYSSSGSTPARLGIGTAGQVLQVNSGATAPEWATPAGGGGMTLIETLSLSGSSVTSSSIASTYKHLYIVGRGIYNASSGDTNLLIRFNSDTGNNYGEFGITGTPNSNFYNNQATSRIATLSMGTASAYNQVLSFEADIPRYSNSEIKSMQISNQAYSSQYTYYGFGWVRGVWNNTAAITTLTFSVGAGTFSAGSIYIYGVN